VRVPAQRRELSSEQRAALNTAADRGAGVITWVQARAAGLTPSQIETLVRRGEWLDAGHGALAQAGRVDDLHVAARRLMAIERRAVISHATAAVLLGLPHVDKPPVPTMTVERGQRGQTGVYVARLTAEHVTHVGGLPITTEARTLVDLLRTVPDRFVAQVLADGARRRGVEGVEAVLGDSRGWPGIRQARCAWGRSDARVESPLESRTRVWFIDGGLPEPDLQVVLGDESRSARVDFLFRAQRTVVESDGRIKYDEPAALWAEKNREDWLRDLGFEVVRATWADGRDGGAALVRRVLRAFERNAQRAA
jgi:hypothetical protein